MNLGGASSPAEAQIERRIISCMLGIVAIWLVLGARLFYLQVIEGDSYRVSAEKNSVRTHRVIASRGMILDRTGAILVDSRPAFDVGVVPYQTEKLDVTIQRLSGLLDEDPTVLRARYGRPSGPERFQPKIVAHDVDYRLAARVGERLWALPGVVTQADPVRFYAHGSSAAHLLGMLGEISQSELASQDYREYRRGDVIGKDGIERLLDRPLRGQDGGRNVLVDAYGRELQVMDEIKPQPGNNVVLTLDHRLQHIAETKLDELKRTGAVVAIDPRNGDVLVLASRPSFDPNHFSRGIGGPEWQGLLADPARPLHNRALLGMFPPGSVYKAVTALAGLEKGIITPDLRIYCGGSFPFGGRRYRCWKKEGHGSMDVHSALVQSCDVFFYRVGQQLGVDALAYYARGLGLGSRTGISVKREAPGLVPSSAWKQRRFGQRWMPGETISVSIGQGFNLWTPLQMAIAYAAIGNGGKRYLPQLVKRIEGPRGEVIEERKPEIMGIVPVSERNLATVRSALRGVVHEPRGTGGRMRGLANGVEAAGKTGTAQVVAMGKDPVDEEDLPIQFRDHAWFATYVPAENPRIAIAVLVEHGGHGGSAAAPIARAITDEFLKNELADQPAPPPPAEPTPPPTTPAEQIEARVDARH
jgi:penicillin-binding protein 2